MRAFEMFSHLVTGYAETQRRRHTQRMIENLPYDIRKDIGWPHGHRQSSATADQWR